jgi:hypothetical protein
MDAAILRASTLARLLVLLALLALASQARAEVVVEARPVVQTTPPILVPGQRIPGNGAVLFIDDRTSDVDTFVVRSFLGPIEGTYFQVSHMFWAWLPNVPLASGSYVIESTIGPPTHDADGWLADTITVVDAVDLSLPDLKSEPSVSLVTQPLDTLCCTQWTDVGVLTGECVPTTNVHTVVLDPGLSSSTGAIALSQYMFGISAPAAAPARYVQWSTPLALSFTTQAEEYCYDLAAIAIFDGSMHELDELMRRCAPHGALGELGTERPVLRPSFYDRKSCTAPPEGFEEPWCEHNADCAGSHEAECVLFDHVCHGGPEPIWTPTGIAGLGGGGGMMASAGSGGSGAGGFDPLGGIGGAGGASGTGGAAGMALAGTGGGASGEGTATTGGAGALTSQPSDGEGCSVARAGANARSTTWLLLGLAFALVRVARRRPRAARLRAHHDEQARP